MRILDRSASINFFLPISLQESANNHAKTGGKSGAKRCSSDGNALLPNPRTVSMTLHYDKNVLSKDATAMFAIYGQILSHDLTLAPEDFLQDCCSNPDRDECFSIYVPDTDPHFVNAVKM